MRVGVQALLTIAAVNLPRCDRHPVSHDSPIAATPESYRSPDSREAAGRTDPLYAEGWVFRVRGNGRLAKVLASGDTQWVRKKPSAFSSRSTGL
jgi:hypothetical protein